MSRYYDPVTHRFLNADSIPDTASGSPLSANQFAYCENNPIKCCDNTGNRFCAATSVQSETKIERKQSCICQGYISKKISKPVPRFIDVTEKLDKALTDNYNELSTFRFIGKLVGVDLATPIFVSSVAPGGRLDYKAS